MSSFLVEISHEIISMAILLPSDDSRKVAVSYKRKYEHKVLVNCLVQLAQEKSVVRLTDHLDMTIAVDRDVKNQTKPKTTAIMVNVLKLQALVACLKGLNKQCRPRSGCFLRISLIRVSFLFAILTSIW